MYMYHIFLIHSPVNGHLGCFHVLAITVNSTAVKIGAHVSFFVCLFLFFLVFWFFCFLLFRTACVAYGSSQVRDLVGATAAATPGPGLRLQPTPLLRAMLDPRSPLRPGDRNWILLDTSQIHFCISQWELPVFLVEIFVWIYAQE